MGRNASDLNNVRTDCWLTTTWYQYIYIQTAMLGTREYTLCSPFRANAQNSSLFWGYVSLFLSLSYYIKLF